MLPLPLVLPLAPYVSGVSEEDRYVAPLYLRPGVLLDPRVCWGRSVASVLSTGVEHGACVWGCGFRAREHVQQVASITMQIVMNLDMNMLSQAATTEPWHRREQRTESINTQSINPPVKSNNLPSKLASI